MGLAEAEDEFQKIFLTGLNIPEDEVYSDGLTQPNPTALSDVDWRDKLVTPVKNQDNYCQFRSRQIVARDNGYTNVGRSEYSLQSDLSRGGPIAIAVDAGGRAFGSHRVVIYNNPSCNNRQPNHAMLVVGYGSASGSDYWNVETVATDVIVKYFTL